MSMSIVDGVWAICDDCIAVLVVENNLFANSLISATIQDYLVCSQTISFFLSGPSNTNK